MGKIQKKILKNGLIVLHEKRDVPVTTVMLGAKYGSAYESEKEKGIAHFIEHLCFKGTEKRNVKEIASSVEKVGGTLNAFTSEELTAYHVTLPSNHLELAMDVIFDIFFNPIFPEEDVKKEANVICEEIRMYNDDPRAHTIEKIKNNLYKRPFGISIAGSEENIRGMNRKQLLARHREIYVSKNSILTVVGNNSFEDVLRFADKFVVEREGIEIKVPKIDFQNLKETEHRDNLQQANVAIGFHFPKLGDNGRYAAELFSAILGQGMSSKLFTEVREKRGLVYAVKSALDAGANYGYMMIYAGTDKKNSKEVIDICLKEFSEMGNLTEKELEEAKEQVIGNFEVALEDSNVTAMNLMLDEIAGDGKNFYEYAKKINSVSLKDIQKLAENIEYASFVLSP